jgi:hypothetical protein
MTRRCILAHRSDTRSRAHTRMCLCVPDAETTSHDLPPAATAACLVLPSSSTHPQLLRGPRDSMSGSCIPSSQHICSTCNEHLDVGQTLHAGTRTRPAGATCTLLCPECCTSLTIDHGNPQHCTYRNPNGMVIARKVQTRPSANIERPPAPRATLGSLQNVKP